MARLTKLNFGSAMSSEKILLVGNGPSAAKGSRGIDIDNFDGLVARFNLCVFNDDVGHRVDVWVTWGEQAIFRELGQSKTVLTTSENRRHGQADLFAVKHEGKFERVTNKTDRGVRKYIGHPSAGALATAHFLSSPEIGRVYIFGFDHFAARKHHYWSAVEGEKHGHDPYRESLWFNNLIKQDRITRWNPSFTV